MTTHTRLRLGALALVLLIFGLLSGAHLCGAAQDAGSRPLSAGALACTEFWLNRYQTLVGAFAAVGAAVAAWRLSLNQIAKAQGQIDQMEKQTVFISQQSNAATIEQIGSIAADIDAVLVSVRAFNETVFDFDMKKSYVLQIMMRKMLQYRGQNSDIDLSDGVFPVIPPDSDLVKLFDDLASVVDKQTAFISLVVEKFPHIVLPQEQAQMHGFNVEKCRDDILQIYKWQLHFAQYRRYFSEENADNFMRDNQSIDVYNFISNESLIRRSMHDMEQLPGILDATRGMLTLKRNNILSEMIR